MSSEQDKRPSLVPLGVFGTTAAPSPPPPVAVTSPGVVPAPAEPAPPPEEAAAAVPSAERDSAPVADRPSFPRTLVGVPSLSPEAARAKRGDFPAPPKWQGAAAYAGGAPALRTSSGGPVPPGAQPPPPPPSTALSASTPPVPSAPFPLAKDPPVLGRVNLRSVPATLAGVGAPTGPAVRAPRGDDTEPIQRADDTVEEFDLADALEESSLPTRPLAAGGGSFRSAPPPVPAPHEPSEAAPAAPVTRSSIPPVIVPDFARKDPSEVNIPLAGPRAAPVPAPVPAPAPVRVRPAVEVDPGQPLLGVMFVAAMLVLGVGGWLLTQGGFVRPRHPEVAAKAIAKKLAAPVASPAAVSEPAAAAVPEPEPEPEPEPAAEPEPVPEAEPEPAAPNARRPGGNEPRARRVEPPARPAPVARPSQLEQPRVAPPQLTITPQPGTSTTPSSPGAAAPGGELPETPTRETVTSALDAVRSRVLECAAGKHGVAEVDLTVLSSGDVSHVVVTGDFAGSAEGSCIAREVRAARFGSFQKPRFRLIYPFQL
jgi:hypothetical protein